MPPGAFDFDVERCTSWDGALLEEDHFEDWFATAHPALLDRPGTNLKGKGSRNNNSRSSSSSGSSSSMAGGTKRKPPAMKMRKDDIAGLKALCSQVCVVLSYRGRP